MKTQLPEHFMFSQTSLQNWLTCRRRFQLLYLQQLAYPAPETSDQLTFEQHMANGEQFHHLVHQHQAGIAPEVLEQHIENEAVQVWWERYLSGGLDGLPKQREAEVQLTAPLGDYRLVAQYDLLAVEPGERVVIVDWKTAQKRPRREHLQQRMQTLLYPYLMVEGGAYYNGGQPIQPEQVEMVYWFTNFPLQPERFQYDAAQHAEVEARGWG